MSAEGTVDSRSRVARALLVPAALLSLVEATAFALSPGLTLMSALWAGALLVLARMATRRPRPTGWVLAGFALVSIAASVSWLRVPADERLYVIDYGRHASVSVVHTALLTAAALLLLAGEVPAAWQAQRVASWRDPALAGARLAAAGCGLWALALVLLFPWWFGAVVGLEAAALLPAAAGVAFLLVRRLRAWHARAAAIVAWLSAIVLVLTAITPIAYGTIGIYLALTTRGRFVLLAALGGTALLFRGRRAIREHLADVARTPAAAPAPSRSAP